ncbi:MAG: hypothetical protein EA398_03985 [Deltaproteobacteria bacterium]|nr:MAG: hypothetical protein EA398_03985 [Deltaproteobacteria bacterium]
MMRTSSVISVRTLLLTGLVLLLAACAADDPGASAPTTEPEPPSPAGCDRAAEDAEECQRAFAEHFGCPALNGRWEGEWRETSLNVLGGNLVVIIDQDGCDATGEAVFEDAPCLSSGEVAATVVVDSITASVSGMEGRDPVLISLDGVALSADGDGVGEDEVPWNVERMEFEFAVLESGRLCRDMVGEITVLR